MSSAWLATYLDYQMLETAGVVVDRQRRAGMPDLPLRRGADVAKELAGRFLLHDVTSANVGRYRPGRADRCFVTPTPLSPADTGAWLALPGANIPREFVVLLQPEAIPWIQGPWLLHSLLPFSTCFRTDFPRKRSSSRAPLVSSGSMSFTIAKASSDLPAEDRDNTAFGMPRRPLRERWPHQWCTPPAYFGNAECRLVLAFTLAVAVADPRGRRRC